MDKMPILALDLATQTGWALRDVDGSLASGSERFAVERGDTPGMRYLKFAAWLRNLFSQRQWTVSKFLVVYEQPHQRGGAATEVALGLAATLQATVAELPDAQHTMTHSKTLKKWATGNGNAGKDLMIKRCEILCPDVVLVDDNHADALLLLHHAIDQYRLE